MVTPNTRRIGRPARSGGGHAGASLLQFLCSSFPFFLFLPSPMRVLLSRRRLLLRRCALRKECDFQTDLAGTNSSRLSKMPRAKIIKPTTGLVFVPGARVESRAYARVLRPLAEAGYLVAVLKEPFGFAIVDPDHGKKVLDLHPEIAHWVVGGHSLGGTVAASLADNDDRVEGLVLFASYPADPIIRNDLKVRLHLGCRGRARDPGRCRGLERKPAA